MALAATTIFEVETGGSDTLNGGAFDPGQTAGMFTDGAATVANTSAPVFTSASYNFVAGDVGAWLFVGAGTNWTQGWYTIASVAGGAATLDGTIGAAVTKIPVAPTTVVGCATVASPTGATWSIDYSQQAAAQFAYTDLASVGAGLLVSSALLPFGKQQVGNALVITGGTNFTTGRYVIASVAAGVATVVGVGNITTGAGSAGTGGQGGALASLGQTAAHVVASNQVFQQTGSYTITSASTNIAGGCWSTNLISLLIEGYSSVRGDLAPVGAAGVRPINTASGIATFTMLTNALAAGVLRHLRFDGAGLTSSRGVASSLQVVNVHGQNFTNSAFASNATTGSSYFWCSATGCSAQPAFTGAGTYHACVAYSNTVTGFNTASAFATSLHVNCLSYNNSGAASDGFTDIGQVASKLNCTAYGNGRDGFRQSGQMESLTNCVAENNTGAGFTLSSIGQALVNCAGYNNTGGNTVTTSATHQLVTGFIDGTAELFTNPGAGDFSLNTTSGGGALLRAAGYPGVFPVGLTTGSLDVGAVQHADAGGGGAAQMQIGFGVQ